MESSLSVACFWFSFFMLILFFFIHSWSIWFQLSWQLKTRDWIRGGNLCVTLSGTTLNPTETLTAVLMHYTHTPSAVSEMWRASRIHLKATLCITSVMEEGTKSLPLASLKHKEEEMRRHRLTAILTVFVMTGPKSRWSTSAAFLCKFISKTGICFYLTAVVLLVLHMVKIQTYVL